MTTPTTTTAAPAPLDNAELTTAARYYRSKNGPLRAYALKLKDNKRNTYRSLQVTTDPTRTPTAAWQPVRLPDGRTEHAVTLSALMPQAMPPKAAAVKTRRAAAVKALLRHEACHIAHTAADYVSTLVPLMRRANVPFSLFNLHEDARIEALAASATSTPFNWTKHLSAPPARTDNPTALFYALIYHETRTAGTWTGSPADAQWIREHYDKTTNPTQTPDSRTALLRAFEFAQRFALSWVQLPPHQATPAPDGNPDPAQIPTPAPDGADQIKAGTPPAGSAAPPPANPDGPHQCAPNSTGGTPEDIPTAILRDLPSVFLNFARRPFRNAPQLGDANRTAAELAAMARRAGIEPVQLGQAGSRIHAPAVAVGAPAAFRRLAPTKGPRRLCLIIDMSGSMESTYTEHAAAFAAAALELNRSRALAVDVWLSQTGTAAKLPPSTRPETLALFGAYGSGEGLSNTMRTAAADMAAASAVVVYTDAQLGADKLPRRIRGQDIIGAVCAADHNAAHMQRQLREHFDRALVATTPHQLAREIVRYVLTRPV